MRNGSRLGKIEKYSGNKKNSKKFSTSLTGHLKVKKNSRVSKKSPPKNLLINGKIHLKYLVLMNNTTLPIFLSIINETNPRNF